MSVYVPRRYESDPSRCEMGFDLSAYQPSLAPLREHGPRLYQTIFLDDASRKELWTIDEIDKAKVVDSTWWVAFAHTYSHFRNAVPWVWALQRPRSLRTLYAGSWTLFNTHDVAIASGLAAAARLGAAYPFKDNKLAAKTYEALRRTAHFGGR